MKRPESMQECVYYSFRDIGDGEATVWVFREKCPECGKGLMGKPIKKDGKPKTRAKEYQCPECGHIIEKQEYEESLTACVDYTCPECKHNGEAQVPFKWKSIKSVKTIRIACEKCKANIDITKKMKAPK